MFSLFAVPILLPAELRSLISKAKSPLDLSFAIKFFLQISAGDNFEVESEIMLRWRKIIVRRRERSIIVRCGERDFSLTCGEIIPELEVW